MRTSHTTCVLGAEFYCPNYHYFTDYTEASGYPPGIARFGTCLLTAWTCGAYMSKIFPGTILNPRSSCCESFFHLLDVWLPKCLHFSDWGYLLGMQCAVLTWNEMCCTRKLTSGTIVSGKGRGDGILRAQQRRDKTMLWRMKILEAAFPSSKVMAAIVADATEAATKRRERRAKFVAKFEQQKSDLLHGKDVTEPLKSLRGEARSTLLACPVKLEASQLAFGAGGLTNCKCSEAADQWGVGESSQWTPPFPLPRGTEQATPASAAQALVEFDHNEAVVADAVEQAENVEGQASADAD
jgi:hypothetical protein